MKKARNILFIMFDQLRFDYLSCSGHAHLKTPHIDKLASQGVRLSRCYVQSPICGASRMSFYTGRYVNSHGASWNNYPLKVGEQTLGDHLRECGMDSWLVGKTHMAVDTKGLQRLGINADSVVGARVSECGFDVFVRDDGLWAKGPDGQYNSKPSAYNEYLKSKQYPGENPWHDYANSGVEDDMEIASGWLLKHAEKPANIREEDSETPWLTREAIRFIDEQVAKQTSVPWHCHLSYIKPHWPYIVPKPYHDMYTEEQVQPVIKDVQERENPHPVYGAYMNNAIAQAISTPGVREKVIPAYMGLIKQCDDQLGVLFAHLEKTGRMDDTLIVVTSDHGDYLGDHWLGEKDLFHECSVKVPLIIYDPSTEADNTRGTVCDELVESIDLAATFIEVAGGEVPEHIVEGRSLLPYLYGNEKSHGEDKAHRQFVISEFDYSATPMAAKLGLEPDDARLFMVADKRWKFMHAEGGFRPMLFDMENDPNELHDLAGAAEAFSTESTSTESSEQEASEYQNIIDLMYARLSSWALRSSQRNTKSSSDIKNMRGKSRRKGILLGVVDGSELDDEILAHVKGRAAARYTDT